MPTSHESPRVEPHPSWTSQEKWVWEQVQKGETADFNSGQTYGGRLDPKNATGWTPQRVLRPEFLLMVLLKEPYRKAIPHTGARIVGAWFNESLDLSFAEILHPLLLGYCRFDKEVTLVHVKASSSIYLMGSKFSANLVMNSMDINGDLLMRDGAAFSAVDLTRARIRGNVEMSSSTFTGRIDMNSVEIAGHLSMSGAKACSEVDLTSARVTGQVLMMGAEFTGKVSMGGLEVGEHLMMSERAVFADVDLMSATVKGQVALIGSRVIGTLNMCALWVGDALLMRDGANFSHVILAHATINGQLDLSGSKFTGRLNMDSLRVHRDLYIRNAIFACSGEKYPVDFMFTQIGANLDISGTTFPSVDLTGTRVQGELRLGSDIHGPVRWQDGATLTLRNTEVAALQDREDAWPDKVILEGFTFGRVGGFRGNSGSMAGREIAWLKKWLEKSDYSPQPYEQLASVLQHAGNKEKADEVLYAKKQRERKSTSGFRCGWMLLQEALIGYGFRYRRSMYWIGALTVSGMAALYWSSEGPSDATWSFRFFYTLDMILPIVELDKAYDGVVLTGWIQIYFYFLKIMGFVLGSFIVAGLSGLTKK